MSPDEIRLDTVELQARLAAIVSSSDDAIISKDLDGIIQSWNPAAERIFGYTEAEMIGEPILRLIPPERPGEEEQILARIRQGERVDHFETVRVRKDGKRINLSVTISPIRGAGGRIVGASKIARDISTQAQIQHSLRESEQRLMAIIGSATDAIITVDEQQRITLFNTAAERMFCCPASEAMGQTLDKFIPVRYRDLHREHIRQFGQTGISARAMGNHRPLAALRSDGTEFPVEATISQIDAAGQRLFTAIVRDVTERHRQAEALLESEGRLRAIVETAVDGIITIDERGRVRTFNPAAERIFGYEPDEVIGRNVNMLMPAPYHEEHDRYLSDYASTGIRKIIGSGREVIGRRKDGSTFPMDLAVSETVLGDRRIFTGIVRDITERKRAELEREQLLERERFARAEAERASRLKDEFLATVSHELRTPLNAIYGWSQLLQRKEVGDDEVVEGLEVIARNARVQTQLVEDLLDMSRIISGKIRLDLEPVDMAAVVDAAVQTVLPAAQAKQIRVQKVMDAAPGPVMGDPSRLQQVIWNLLSNAVKFTPAGGRVQVKLEREGEDAVLTVVDTGEGIAPGFLPHLFERFQQADASTTRRHGGLGLGLAIVKHLVELHGGSVSVSSRGPGEGAAFRVLLPLKAARVESRGLPSAPPEQPIFQWNHVISLQGLKVLVVDDEPDALRLVARILGEHGVQVLTAGSADEGIAAIRSFRPDVLVTDIGMPHEDGFGFLRRVRALPEEEVRNVHAVALTAFARPEDRARALLSGFQTHVSKPVEPAELLVVIAQLARRLT